MNTTEHKHKLRVGVLLDSMRIAAWEHALLERIVASGRAEICLVLLLERINDRRGSPSGANSMRYGLYDLYHSLERRIFKPKPNAFARRDASDFLRTFPLLTLKPDHRDCFSDQEIELIRKHRPDILLELSSTLVKGEITHIPQFGTWSFQHYWKGKARAIEDGFWEVIEGKSATQCILYQRGRDHEHDTIIGSYTFSTDKESILRNVSRHAWKRAVLAPRKLEELSDAGAGEFDRRIVRQSLAVPPPPPPKDPTTARLLIPLARHFSVSVRRKVQRRAYINQWILLFNMGDKNIARDLGKFRKIIPPYEMAWADPHIVFRDGTYYIFIEECPLKPKKGRIAVIVMDEDGNYEGPRTIIERPYHLSYPFIFEFGGELYMIPESSANKTIELHRCKSFPYEWEFHKNLMTKIDAVDATLLPYEERWWMFAGVRENEGYPNWDELFLFHAKSPLDSTWIPHPLNPIVSDVHSARPAGPIFRLNGNIYRPSQDCSKRYGYGVRLNQIMKLNPREFEEQEVSRIEPAWDRSIIGVHTLSHEHNLTFVDGIYKRRRHPGS